MTLTTQQLAESRSEPTVIDGVLFGRDAEVGAFVQTILGKGPIGVPFVALGIVRAGEVVGGVYFANHDRTRGDIEATVAIDDSAAGDEALLRPTLRRLLGYPFGQLACKRITIYVEKGNTRSLEQAQRLGFVIEGEKRGTDVLMLGLLPDECPYWKDEAR